MTPNDLRLPFLLGFGERGWAIACAASRPFLVTGCAELGDPDREEYEIASLVLALRSPETSITVVTCEAVAAAGVARIVRGAVFRADQPRGWVIAVVEAPSAGAALANEGQCGLADLRSVCHAVVLGTADPSDPDGGAVAATRALVGMCGHRGWVAIHPEDVLAALKGCGLVRVGSVAGRRADLLALAERAGLCADVGGRPGEDGQAGVLVHLEASDEDGIWTDLIGAVGAVAGHMPPDPDELWAYTVSAREECRVTVLLAPRTTSR